MFDFLKRYYKKPILNKTDLLSSIERTSNNLQDILNDPSIKLVLVTSVWQKPYWDYKQQWKNKARFQWLSNFRRFSEFNKSFTLALYADDTLSGLCRYTVRGGQSRKIEISLIEGNPNPHPLKGYVIGAFSECSLSLSQKWKYNAISVYLPVNQTRKIYKNLGYPNTNSIGSPVMKVSKNTKLNWPKTIKHQKKKERLPSVNF